MYRCRAEEDIRAAAESALSQTETGAVILVENGSPDGAPGVCQEHDTSYDEVRLARHPGGCNRGDGASRDIGIMGGRHDRVAFLDADDFYLEGRFSEAAKLFGEHEDIDGVYGVNEVVWFVYEDAEARKKWLACRNHRELTILDEKVPPDKLFSALISSNAGLLHLDGLALNRKALDRRGFFFKHVRLRRDTIFCKLLHFSECIPED